MTGAEAGPVATAEGVGVNYAARRRSFWSTTPPPSWAVRDISFTIGRSETLGMVGESGSGKSTIGRALLGAVPLAAGRVRVRGTDLSELSPEALRQMRRHMQPVLQDPYSSLNPRMTIGEIVAEPLLVHNLAGRAEARDRVAVLLTEVGLTPDYAGRLPGGLSGGQRQRVGIARALSVHPDLIVADEPVSALDVSVRAQVVNLFQDLQERLGVAYLFIAHDLAVVRQVSHRIAIVYAGRIVEMGPRDQIYGEPRHPYTRALLDAVPTLDPAHGRARGRARRALAHSEAPATRPTSGCAYAPLCPMAVEVCRREVPAFEEKTPSHHAACWRT